MADKNTLREMSQDILVIPFSEDVAETLDRFCGNQADGMDRTRFEELTMSFLTRENDEELTEEFDTFCKEEGLTNNLSQEAVIPVLAEYIVLSAIESVEARESSLFSLLLKNALILAAKGDGFVAYPKAIAETFDIYYDYLMDERTFGKEDENHEVTRSLLNADDETLTDKLNDADGKVLKAIVYDSATYRYKEMVESITIDTANLPQSIYDTTKKLLVDTPWQYIDREPAETITKILGEASDAELKLSDVIESLNVEDEYDELLKTSILLRLIQGDDEDISLSGDVIFKASEFAMYLYYEMLAETISKEIDETEE